MTSKNAVTAMIQPAVIMWPVHSPTDGAEPRPPRHAPPGRNNGAGRETAPRRDRHQCTDRGDGIGTYPVPRQQADRRLDDAERSILQIVGRSRHSAGAGGK